MTDPLVIKIVSTLIFTLRILAATFALIGLVNWVQYRRRDEHPPYNRKVNEHAWNWAFLGCAIGASSFVYFDIGYRVTTGDNTKDLFVLAVWWCWANAATVRLSSKAARPRYVYLAASIFIIAGGLYAFLTGG